MVKEEAQASLGDGGAVGSFAYQGFNEFKMGGFVAVAAIGSGGYHSSALKSFS